MADGSSDRAILWMGIASAVLSGASTYLFPLSVVAYPIFIVLFVIAWRRNKRVAPPSRPATFGIALGVAALLMPALCGLSWWIFVTIENATRPNGPLVTGEPFFYAIYTPPVIATLICLAAAWRKATKKSRERVGREGR